MSWQDYRAAEDLSAILTAAHTWLDRAGAPPAPPRLPWADWQPTARARRRRTPPGHGSSTFYRNGCRCDECRQWKADSRATVQRRRPQGPPVFVRYRPTFTLACTCGHEAHEVADLIRHTLATHGRPPTKTERTPQRRQEAA